jgi:hypothetical protein
MKKEKEQIEALIDIMCNQIMIFSEFMNVIKEIPLGKQLYNLAINRVKLKNLEKNILIRRQITLNNIENQSLPKNIEKLFIGQQKKLIKIAMKDINHRQNFDIKSSTYFQQMFNQLELTCLNSKK